MARLLHLRLAQELDGAAGLLDLLARARGDRVHANGELLGDLPGAEELHVDPRVLDDPLLDEGLRRHLCAGVEAVEVAHVHRHRLRAERADRHRVLRRRAALLADAHVDRHLAALEAGAHLVRAGARLLALDPAAGVAALARAGAAADALSIDALLRGLDVREVQLLRHVSPARPSRGGRPSAACLREPGSRRARRSSRSCRARGAQRAAMRLALADLGLDLCELDLRHHSSPFFRAARGFGASSAAAAAGSSAGAGLYGRTSEICLPRIFATSSGRRRSFSATIVAFAMLIGFVVPRLLARTLRTPASSSTARTPPPAITPVPSEAGRSMTRAASKRPSTSCVIVDPCFGTVNRFFFASSTAFVIASGTSRALP